MLEMIEPMLTALAPYFEQLSFNIDIKEHKISVDVMNNGDLKKSLTFGVPLKLTLKDLIELLTENKV